MLIPTAIAVGVLPDWWEVDNSGKTLTLQDGELIVNADAGTVAISVRQHDETKQFSDGYELIDALGHKQLAIYTQWYPLDNTRREGVIEMYAHETNGDFTGGHFIAYGGGNFDIRTDTSVVYPIYVTNSNDKKIFLLRKEGGVIFGGEGTAVPDSDLSNGGFGLWLDPTNGATKLMIKAKSTNGTVVTGNVALA